MVAPFVGQWYFMPLPEDAPADQILVHTKPRPWVRFFARQVDYMLIGSALGVMIAESAPHMLGMPRLILGMVVMINWVFIEAYLLSSWGSTPGKWLLASRVGKPGAKRLTYGEALWRSYRVLLRGLGFGIPIVSLITQISAFSELRRNGETSWDRDGNATVMHGKLRVGGVLLTVLIWAGFFVLMAIG